MDGGAWGSVCAVSGALGGVLLVSGGQFLSYGPDAARIAAGKG